MVIPRIAIVGAGPGGLTLARILQQNGIECTTFELDEDRFSRGYSSLLDLHGDSGQLALREAGLFEIFQEHCVTRADSMKLMKADGTVVWDENDPKLDWIRQARNRPEIDRTTLRDLLVDSIKPDSIHWGSKINRVEPSTTSPAKFDLHLANGVEEGFDLIIGADGAWSKVRHLVSDETPDYSGIVLVELNADDVDQKKKWLSDFVGSGSLFMFDDGRSIICQRNVNGGIRVGAALRQPESWVKDCGFDWDDHDHVRKQLNDLYYSDCHEDLKRVISEASDGLTLRSLYMLPVGFRWPARPGVTLLGDAAHLMTPFGGVGVNVAMSDAMYLAKAIIKQRDNFQHDLEGSLSEAIKEYEEEMFVRAKGYMEMTYEGLQSHFSADGVDKRVQKIQKRIRQMKEAKTQRLS